MSTYQISDAQLDELTERVANDDSLYRELISLRGGCRCHINPPCGACCNPLTASEAIDLGLEEAIDEAIRMGWTAPRWWQWWRWRDQPRLTAG